MENNFYKLILYFLSVYSLTYGFIESPLAENIKKFLLRVFKGSEKIKYALQCYHCSGFQIGILIYLIQYKNVDIINLFIYSLSAAIVNVILQNIVMFLFSKTSLNFKLRDGNN